MADPFAIIGLAASILTFVDFGAKVISLTKSIHDSPANMAPDTQELSYMLEDIRSLSNAIQKSTSLRTRLSEDETKILRVASQCDKLAEELGNLLETLKIRDDTALPRAIEITRVALRTARKKKHVDSLQERLKDLERSLRGYLTGTLHR